MSEPGFQRLAELFHVTHERLHRQAVRSVDTALVIRNWLFGFYIVEFEDGGAERPKIYEKGLINHLSRELKQRGLKGISATNLKQCRSFYLSYREIGQTASDQSFLNPSHILEIRQTLSDPSSSLSFDQSGFVQSLAAQLAANFQLGWSHYVVICETNLWSAQGFTALWFATEWQKARQYASQYTPDINENTAGITPCFSKAVPGHRTPKTLKKERHSLPKNRYDIGIHLPLGSLYNIYNILLP